MQPAFPLILASGSPRRRELLDQMGLIYTVDSPDVDENFGRTSGRNRFGDFQKKGGSGCSASSECCYTGSRYCLFLPMNRLENRIRPSVQKKC